MSSYKKVNRECKFEPKIATYSDNIYIKIIRQVSMVDGYFSPRGGAQLRNKNLQIMYFGKVENNL